MTAAAPGPGAILQWDVGAPPTWCPLPLAALDGPSGAEARAALESAAGQLAEEGEARDGLLRQLAAVHPGLLDDHLILLAAWVPDRAAGVAQGVLRAELVLDAELARFERLVHASAPPPDQERLHLETLRVDLPAGPSVLVDHQGVVDGSIEQYLQFMVFPEGTTDAISLTASTTALHLVEEFAVDLRDIADSLVVEVGAEGDR